MVATLSEPQASARPGFGTVSHGSPLTVCDTRIGHRSVRPQCATHHIYLSNSKVVGTDKAGYPVNRLTPTAIKAEPPDVPEVFTRHKVLSSTGGNVTLRCSLRSLLPAVVHWLKDGTPLAGPQRFRGSYDFPLHISRISTESAGTYFCTASNDIGAASSPVLLEIKATSTAPQVRLFPAEVQFRTGDHVKLTCDAKGSPRPAVKWNVAPALRDRVHINGTTLTLLKAEAGDELREITCMASNAAGSDAKRPTLQHVDPPKITGREGAVVTVAKGSSLTLSCAASGTPQPQVRWSKSGLPVTSGLQSDGSLLITGAGETDAGDYTCNAVSPAGADSYTVRVHVLLPPQMEESVSQETYKVIENSPFSLQCRSSGSPIPLLEWHKDGRKVDTIAENLGMEFTPERDVLRVAAAKFLHDGVYKCVASNVAGSTERSFRIIVLRKHNHDLVNALRRALGGYKTKHLLIDNQRWRGGWRRQYEHITLKYTDIV
ncbi:hypothetical protein HPB50_028546 [Hyalomma asiaticum]|nr:hypothetical protein HPB50_028546 [Hyalomma asiaticum]